MRMTFLGFSNSTSSRRLRPPKPLGVGGKSGSSFVNYWIPIAIGMTILLGLHFAGVNAFMQDDAYISYRYAKWFSRGYGLVWYPGSTEFGYTNFLYTLLIGLGMLAHIPPEVTSNTINVLSFVAALLLSFYIAHHITQQRVAAFATMFLLATHHTFTGYATGGLETMFFTALILGFYALLIRFLSYPEFSKKILGVSSPKERWMALEFPRNSGHDRSNARLLPIMGLVASLALLTRLDAALLLFPGYVYLFLCHSCEGGNLLKSFVTHWVRCASAAIIPALVLSVFLASCYVAYGYILPNTFYIKVPTEGGNIAAGFHYLKLYAKWHAYMPVLIPFFLLFYHFRFRHLGQFSTLFYLALSVLIVWLSYILYVGGDFMEFRFLVPILPFFFATIFGLFFHFIKKHQRNYFLLVVGLLWLGNWSHGLPRYYMDMKTYIDNFVTDKIAPFDALQNQVSGNVVGEGTNWSDIGKVLYKLFSNKLNPPSIAVLPSGAIPYFSELPTLDQLGLNTRAIINHNARYTNVSGHRLRLLQEYIKQQNVNLIIDHPIIWKRVERCGINPNFWAHQFLPDVQMIYIPLTKTDFLMSYYLTPHPRIEQLIKEKKIFHCIP